MKELETILDKNLLNNTLKNGGVIAFVTDTVWGLGCLPTSKDGVDKIYEIKGRDRSKPLILMSDKVENLYPYVKEVPQQAREFVQKYFPGALTLVLEKSDKTKEYITAEKNTVGIRVPNNEFFKQLCSIIDGTRQGAKVGDFYIVNCTSIPAVLIECGFLSNEVEENLLTKIYYQNKVCYSILSGIISYLNQ